jgi:hypothetical protein
LLLLKFKGFRLAKIVLGSWKFQGNPHYRESSSRDSRMQELGDSLN